MVKRFCCLAVLAIALWSTGAGARDRWDRESRLDGHDALRMRADAAIARLLSTAHALSRGYRWEVQVVDGGVHDARAYPHGEIVLSARFVDALRLTDSELAMLLAHEIGHVLAGHAMKRASLLYEETGLPPLFGVIGPLPSSEAPELDALSRRQELEADELGLELALRAGWPASELIGFYEKVRRRFGDISNRSHPPVTQRLRRLQGLAQALAR